VLMNWEERKSLILTYRLRKVWILLWYRYLYIKGKLFMNTFCIGGPFIHKLTQFWKDILMICWIWDTQWSLRELLRRRVVQKTIYTSFNRLNSTLFQSDFGCLVQSNFRYESVYRNILLIMENATPRNSIFWYNNWAITEIKRWKFH
jgi:hypothetical protein